MGGKDPTIQASHETKKEFLAWVGGRAREEEVSRDGNFMRVSRGRGRISLLLGKGATRGFRVRDQEGWIVHGGLRTYECQERNFL